MYMEIYNYRRDMVNKFIFTGGLLIKGTGEVVENSMVVVEDKKIRYAGPKKI